ncbi:histidine phosphatase family protein [Parahaliea mediterranea]|uniref:Histidine phosphatase family protein n=1 Tax=Parahaliea mediterranea TaxID=651086 RepID=A0A939DBC2_9GAMM|nr:histidine phosphatase family protein [Parahaliea mediterranea]MBN7795118.1 histidine phosphatase family protein [Parahaliea mediterranea]
MDIMLVRHGEASAEWGQHEDPGLSALGRQQAAEAAEALRVTVNPDWGLYSSPQARAMETAEPLARSLGVAARIEEAFREIPAPVPLAGRKAWLRQFMRESWRTQPDSLWQWREGILGRLRELGAPAVVYTHFLVINTVVVAAEERDDTLCFWPDNGSITHLRLEGGRLSVVTLGRAMKTVVN